MTKEEKRIQTLEEQLNKLQEQFMKLVEVVYLMDQQEKQKKEEYSYEKIDIRG